MKAAVAPYARRDDARLLLVERASGKLSHHHARSLAGLLRPGDLVVVNDAAAMPASLFTADGTLELRLLGPIEDHRAEAVAFGPGDWRQRTEDRPSPRALHRHDALIFREGLRAHIDAADPEHPRRVTLHFEARTERILELLYRAGRPIQYSYTRAPLELWDVQTLYAGPPVASEMPSAGAVITFATVRRFRECGIELATLTHAAGISSTGDEALDRLLPLPERYELPERTVSAIQRAKRESRRIIAVGTSVVRALEGNATDHDGVLIAGRSVTDLRLSPAHRLRIVDGLLTGVHDPSTSHYELLGAFASKTLLESASREAEAQGYLGHEFGDVMLLD